MARKQSELRKAVPKKKEPKKAGPKKEEPKALTNSTPNTSVAELANFTVDSADGGAATSMNCTENAAQSDVEELEPEKLRQSIISGSRVSSGSRDRSATLSTSGYSNRSCDQLTEQSLVPPHSVSQPLEAVCATKPTASKQARTLPRLMPRGPPETSTRPPTPPSFNSSRDNGELLPLAETKNMLEELNVPTRAKLRQPPPVPPKRKRMPHSSCLLATIRPEPPQQPMVPGPITPAAAIPVEQSASNVSLLLTVNAPGSQTQVAESQPKVESQPAKQVLKIEINISRGVNSEGSTFNLRINSGGIPRAQVEVNGVPVELSADPVEVAGESSAVGRVIIKDNKSSELDALHTERVSKLIESFEKIERQRQ